jgi:hypothetical protein
MLAGLNKTMACAGSSGAGEAFDSSSTVEG